MRHGQYSFETTESNSLTVNHVQPFEEYDYKIKLRRSRYVLRAVAVMPLFG